MSSSIVSVDSSAGSATLYQVDLLTDVITSTRLEGRLLHQTSFHSPWGLHFPCPRSAGFHIVTQGQVWVRSPHLEAPLSLSRGDALLVGRGVAHELASGPEVPAVSLEAFSQQHDAALPPRGARPLSTLVCGVYTFQNEAVHPLFDTLPRFFVLTAEEVPAPSALQAALLLLTAELKNEQPGREIVLHRLTDLLFVALLRHWMAEESVRATLGPSWSRALRDPGLGRALEAMHSEVARDWTLESLAQQAGLSRAAFAARFKSLTGETPFHYLTRLRVQRAVDLMKTNDPSLQELAAHTGYADAFAFSKAFKRMMGASPRAFRKTVERR
ncbi:MAG: AraC family transcriptional regulator [Myxococcales bacterium]|nr:AraC family transcriptional regulator [Myxococcales bacterium]